MANEHQILNTIATANAGVTLTELVPATDTDSPHRPTLDWFVDCPRASNASDLWGTKGCQGGLSGGINGF